MQANAGHLIIPVGPFKRFLGDMAEYDAAKKVFRRTKNKKLPGRALVVKNTPFKNDKGETKVWNQLQVASFAMEEALRLNVDVIRVQTPGMEGIVGEQVLSEWDFSVKELKDISTRDPLFFIEMKDGTVALEDEARNRMPHRWSMRDNVWAPAA